MRKRLEATPGVDTASREERLKRASSTNSMLSQASSRSGGLSARRKHSVSPTPSIDSDTGLPRQHGSVTPPAKFDSTEPRETGVSTDGASDKDAWAARVNDVATSKPRDGDVKMRDDVASSGHRKGTRAGNAAGTVANKQLASDTGAGRSKPALPRFLSSTTSSRRRHSTDATAIDSMSKLGPEHVVRQDDHATHIGSLDGLPASQTLLECHTTSVTMRRRKSDLETLASTTRLMATTVSSRLRTTHRIGKETATGIGPSGNGTAQTSGTSTRQDDVQCSTIDTAVFKRA